MARVVRIAFAKTNAKAIMKYRKNTTITIGYAEIGSWTKTPKSNYLYSILKMNDERAVS
jgi:hypothetical protein